jgi:hypothetical protein
MAAMAPLAVRPQHGLDKARSGKILFFRIATFPFKPLP